jgi:2-hydroxy-4-carboxymuconate semialdehyde hemiacetal dehydrogenase
LSDGFRQPVERRPAIRSEVMSTVGKDAITVGILGYGAIADYHATALRLCGANIAAVAGPNEDEALAFAARHAIPEVARTTNDFLAMPGIEAIVIASPTRFHAAQAHAALESGRHVLCEIPIATSYASAEHLAEFAQSRNLQLMVAHTQRFRPPFRLAHEAINLRIAQVSHVICRYAMLRRENRGWTGRNRSWTDDLLWHHGAHAIDTCLWFLGGRAVDVVARAADERNAIGGPMDLMITMRSPAGALATVALSYNSRLPFNDYLVVAQDDSWFVNETSFISSEGSVFAAENSEATLVAGVSAQTAEFLNSLRTGRRPESSVEDILECMRVLGAVEVQVGTTSGSRSESSGHELRASRVVRGE